MDTPLDGVVFRRRAGTGTIIIDPASSTALEGSYQCTTRNQLGAAVTDLAIVRMAGTLQTDLFLCLSFVRRYYDPSCLFVYVAAKATYIRLFFGKMGVFRP